MGFDIMVSAIISVCGCITGLSAVAALGVSLGKKAKEPDNERDRRILRCENDIKEIHLKLEKDLMRLKHLEYGDRVTQRALLALLRHGIDGNDIEEMKKARDELDEYLLNHDAAQ